MEKEVIMQIYVLMFLLLSKPNIKLHLDDKDEGYLYRGGAFCDSIVNNIIYLRDCKELILSEDLDITIGKNPYFFVDTLENPVNLFTLKMPCVLLIEMILPKYYPEDSIELMLEKARSIHRIVYIKETTEEEIQNSYCK